MPTDGDYIRQAKHDVLRLRVLVSVVIANPTQANVDAVVTAAASTSTLVPKPNYSSQGVSFQWAEYMAALEASYLSLKKMEVVADGSFEVRSRGI